jgi:hypothetical protein
MAPALLGYRELAEEEKAVLKLLSIRRFSGKRLLRPSSRPAARQALSQG